MNIEKKIRVLISAFACEPDEGSEPEVGWKWATLMAQHCELTVLTQAKNRARIEKWMEAKGSEAPSIRFEYHELAGSLRKIKKISTLFNQLYYFAWQLSARRRVSEIISQNSIEVMHHVTYASFRYPVIKTDLPVIWGPVGGAEICPPHLLFRHGKVIGVVRELSRNASTWCALKLLRFICPIVKGEGKGIVLASTPTMRSAFHDHGITAELFPTIGISSHEFVSGLLGDAADQGEKKKELKLIYVGRLHPLKGLHLVLEALGRINDSAIKLSIIGSGSDEERLRRLTRKFGLTSQVTFEGFVDRVDLPAWFAKNDVLVATSLYESGGLSVLEAGANGLPAIALDCGGHSLSVPENGGVKIDPTSSVSSVIENIASAIIRYRDSPELIGSHGNELKKHLEANYEWEKKSRKMLDKYNSFRKSY